MAVRLEIKDRACTDDVCQWNTVNWNGVEPMPVDKITLYSDKAKSSISKGVLRRKRPEPPLHDEKMKLVDNISNCSAKKPVGLSLFASTAELFVPKKKPTPVKQLPPDLNSIFNGMTTVEYALNVTSEQVEYLEEQTRLQSKSIVWHSMRIGRVTASICYDAVHTNKENPFRSLMKKICFPDEEKALLNVPALQWGGENEKNGLKEYVKMSTHKDLVVSQCGLYIDESRPYVAATPDGLTSCSCCGKGVLEIKCPYSYRDVPVEKMASEASTFLNTDGKLKKITNTTIR